MSFLHRWLTRGGRLPEDLRAELAGDGLWLEEQQLPGSITYRHYRAPGEFASYRKELVSTAVAVSRHRFVVVVGKAKHIDLPVPMPSAVEVSREGDDRLCIAYRAEQFRSDRSGQVEVRCRTASAPRMVDYLYRG